MSESRIGGEQIGSWLKARSEAFVGCVSFFLVLLLAVVDFCTSAAMRLTLFYVLIIAFAAWYGGKRAGFATAGTSSLILLIREIRFAGDHAPSGVTFWNVGMQVGVYLLAGRTMSALRTLTRDLKWRVSDRAAALEREAVERVQTEEQLLKTVQQLRQLAENLTDVFWLRDAGATRIGYVNPAFEKIWGRSTRDLYERPQVWWEAVHPDDRERVNPFVQNPEVRVGYDQEYRVVRPDGSVRWVRERTFPVRDGAGQVVRIVGIAEDNTERRRLEREILEVSDREHARIGQDLHDSLCQKLVALAFDLGSLEQRLTERAAPEAASIARSAGLLDDLITEARATARGLFPVQLETDGLGAALQQLAAGVNSRGGVECRVQCEESVFVRENAMAIHLYRIAQEAVNNAVKHSKGRLIQVRLSTTQDRVELRVTDDGVGVALPWMPKGGMGLHIMEYRARMIGGTLSITRVNTGGTVVTCSAPQSAE